MFRAKQQNEIKKENFGVGSIIGGDKTKYLVIAHNPTTVSLVNLNTWTLLFGNKNVADCNWLTQEEAYALTDLTPESKNWTRTDFDFFNTGFK